jgi:N-methylhydantoinase B
MNRKALKQVQPKTMQRPERATPPRRVRGLSSSARVAPLSRTIDPVTFTVLLHRFKSIAKEMTLTLEYTAWTSILALAQDFSCALFDNEARQIAMADALPIHTNSMHVVIEEIARVFAGDIADGDVIVCNDPYSGNTHVGDVVTACPVFYKGEHLFWSVTKGHQLDIGSYIPTSVPATAKDVWQEGLTIPPIKFYERGKPREDVIRLYLANVRYREWLYGDLMAQLGSIWTGRKRLIELVDEYGVAPTMQYVDAILDYADRRMRDEIRLMPKGEFVGETWIDSDGQGNTDIYVRATVRIKKDQIEVDYTGSAPQTAGAGNSSNGVLQAAAGAPVLCCIDPAIPHNDGCLRHIVGKAPKGTVCNAEYPASTALATIVPGDPMQDAVWKALAQAMPERVSAGYGRVHCEPVLSGVDHRDGRDSDWGCMLFNGAAGGGASPVNDGWPVIGTIAALGGLRVLSIEMLELLHPMIVERMEIETDSMGHGKNIGGPGVNIVIRPVGGPMECHLFGDGASNPPHGVLGGTAGTGGGNYKENRTTGQRTFCSAKGHMTLSEHEVWIGHSSGGGGYGDPLEREAERVRDDVRDGFISYKSAADIYGVILDSDTFDLDAAATARARRELAARRESSPLVTPDRPSAATWLQEHKRPGDVYVLDPQ